MKNTTITKEMLDFFSSEIEKELEEKPDSLEDSEYERDFVYILETDKIKLSTSDHALAILVTEYLNKKYEE